MTRSSFAWCSLVVALAVSASALVAQTPTSPPQARPRDPMQESLQLTPSRTLSFTTKVGTWMSVDVSPDGRTLVFDLLGDLYTMPIEGGKATPLTRGMAFDNQPRFSPDGKKVVFVSDRDGGWNVWTISLDKRDTVQVTKGKQNSYNSPEWTPDGGYIVVTRGTKLQLYSASGAGAGQQLIHEPAALRTMGAAFGKDPRWIWFAERLGNSMYNSSMGDWQIAVYDRETGQRTPRTTRWGNGGRPALSNDGRWLAYVSRHIDSTGIRLRDLASGDERWLKLGVQRDDFESGATLDVFPGMSFTQDSRALVTTWGGRLWRVPVDGGAPAEIPFEVDVVQAMGPALHFDYPISDSASVIIKQIRDASPSPDGKRIAFTALDRLYVMDWPSGTPRRVTTGETGEYEPAWSPDGRWLVFATFVQKDGGNLWRARADGRASAPQRLTRTNALWQQPVFSPDGKRIVALRGPARAVSEALRGAIGGGAEDLAWIPAAGGDATLIAPAGGLGNPHFGKDTTRLFVYSEERGLVSMRWDGTEVRTHLRVTAPVVAGQGTVGAPAVLVLMSPTSDDALALSGNELYVVPVPYVGGSAPTVVVGGAVDASSFPSHRLTDIGGQFPAWSADGKRVHWSIGNAHVEYDIERAKLFEDSLRVSRRVGNRESGIDTSRSARDSRFPSPDSSQTRDAKYHPTEVRIRITVPRDVPKGTFVLRGARAITMKGTEIIENADVVVRDNRIVSIGPRGAVVPEAHVIDISGKTIMPGFVDTHAHLRAGFEIHREQPWSYAANLAYGVTTARDPQPFTTDILTYEDLMSTGRLLGPRLFSTGPGIFGAGSSTGADIRNLDQARSILRRYAQYYDTKTIKEYVVGNREQRQWVIQAARELGLMPTTEGSLDIRMNITEMIDGYSGHEHTIPAFPHYADLFRLMAESKIAYTPTIIVAYGGPWGENYWYEHSDLLNDAKLQRFTPWQDLEAKILRRGGGADPEPNGGQAGWFHPSQYPFRLIGEQVRDAVAAGATVGVGSHGQLQGLGYHWELWMMQSGGLSTHDALRAATILGADALGLAKDVGSIEPGKLADLLVMDADPLADIQNSKSLRYVVKNGRVYEAATLDEVWPTARKATVSDWVVRER